MSVLIQTRANELGEMRGKGYKEEREREICVIQSKRDLVWISSFRLFEIRTFPAFQASPTPLDRS